MADDRSISGTVKTRDEGNPADVAYRMARDLWFEEHERWPKASDLAFFHLVRLCRAMLELHWNDEAIARVHGAANAKR